MLLNCYECGAQVWVDSIEETIQYMRPLLTTYCPNCVDW